MGLPEWETGGPGGGGMGLPDAERGGPAFAGPPGAGSAALASGPPGAPLAEAWVPAGASAFVGVSVFVGVSAVGAAA